MENAEIWAVIGGVVLTMIGLVTGWVVSRRKILAEKTEVAVKEAYEKGKHDTKHDKLEINIDAAHVKIRLHEKRLGSVEAANSVTEDRFKTTFKNQDAMSVKLDRIIEHMIPKSGQ